MNNDEVGNQTLIFMILRKIKHLLYLLFFAYIYLEIRYQGAVKKYKKKTLQSDRWILKRDTRIYFSICSHLQSQEMHDKSMSVFIITLLVD